MEKDYIIKSLETQRLQLDTFEKIIYFKVPFLCLFASLMSITNGFQQLSTISFEETLPKYSLVFLIIGLVSFKLKFNRLKMTILENPVLDFRNRILNLAEKRKWKIEKDDKLAMIFKKIPIRGYDEYLSYSKHSGERIYVFINQNRIYLKSIHNLDDWTFKFDFGENLSNEKALVQAINAAHHEI